MAGPVGVSTSHMPMINAGVSRGGRWTYGARRPPDADAGLRRAADRRRHARGDVGVGGRAAALAAEHADGARPARRVRRLADDLPRPQSAASPSSPAVIIG